MDIFRAARQESGEHERRGRPRQNRPTRLPQ